MIELPTVFVLGAGASQPMGFPVGYELKDQVVSLLTQGPSAMELQAICGFDGNLVDRFRIALMHSGQTSVDAFLENRDEFLDIGKASIAVCLMRLEDQSRLFTDYTGSWYKLLFSRMNCRFEHFGDNKVSFLTFNYDRTLEEFLFTSLSNSYGRPEKECIEQLTKIPIIHLHGSIGNLPWQGGATRDFNTAINHKSLNIARSGIKIVHEDITDGRDKDFAKGLSLLQNARRIVFLGFGYNGTNMKRLGIEHASVQAVGTGKGLTIAEAQDIQSAWQKISIQTSDDSLALLRSISWR